MLPSVPLPTDNIYKFYALFGLVLIIASIATLALLPQSIHQEIHGLITQFDRVGKELSIENQDIARRNINNSITDAVFYFSCGVYGLPVIFLVGCGLSIYGFIKWYKVIQPKHTELLDLEIDKLKLECESYRSANKSIGKMSSP